MAIGAFLVLVLSAGLGAVYSGVLKVGMPSAQMLTLVLYAVLGLVALVGTIFLMLAYSYNGLIAGNSYDLNGAPRIRTRLPRAPPCQHGGTAASSQALVHTCAAHPLATRASRNLTRSAAPRSQPTSMSRLLR